MNTGHAAHFQAGDGLPTQPCVDYVGERAKGGIGITVTGHTVPYHDADAALSPASYDDRIHQRHGVGRQGMNRRHRQAATPLLCRQTPI